MSLPDQPNHSTPPELSPEFVGGLADVASRFGVSQATVRQWREEGCPSLQKRPYNIEAIRLWINQRVNNALDPTTELSKLKIELEIEKLKREGRSFFQNPTFWIAAIALGVPISKEIRDWLKQPKQQQHITYGTFFTYVKSHGCTIEFKPPDIYVIRNRRRQSFAVICSEDLDTEGPSPELVNEVCKSLGIVPLILKP